MNIDGSNQVLLADVPGYSQGPRFAADGQTVVFFWLHDGIQTLEQVPIVGGKFESMQDLSTEYAYHWAMSPDG